MDHVPIELRVEHAFTRSRVRTNIGLALFANGPLTVAQVVRVTRHDPENVRAALVGDGVTYTFGESLVGLGLVDVVGVGRGRVCELTPRGLEEVEKVAQREHARLATWV